ncbi:hypothetical protein C8R41DRAFT_52496 [Lentinula lateritia]|uniref:DUF6533 domain-containing protein n=1 Tax=Lentinula lateritia TaxID=40482 RepID=A0ABQ8UZU5_9AGAR|nr:hypothetical protein C8R41DRAFT_52496 [Lentinula lateritia]
MLSPDLLKAIIASLEGSEIARIVNIACLALSVYEWSITLDQEIEYFWTGKWTISRILFFLNRYIPPFLVMLGLIEFSIPNPSNELHLGYPVLIRLINPRLGYHPSDAHSPYMVPFPSQ